MVAAVMGLGAALAARYYYYYAFKPSLDKECAFCNETVLQAQTFYKGEFCSALYTHKPIVNGHCLIIPNRHVQRYEDLSADEVGAMNQMIKNVNAAVNKVLEKKEIPYILLQKNGPEAGQTVPHVHLHYMPQNQVKGSVVWFAFRSIVCNSLPPLKKEEMQRIVAQFKTEMERLYSEQIQPVQKSA